MKTFLLNLFLFCLLATAATFAEDMQEAKITEGKIKAAEPPKQMDRMEGSKAAAKAAAAGAAQSKIACMQTMQDAMKEKDKTTKALLMMAANQQCQQANEMEKSAAENDKGRKSLSQDDIPKQAQYEAGKFELTDSKVKETILTLDDKPKAKDDSSKKDDSIPVAEAFQPELMIAGKDPGKGNGPEKENLEKVSALPEGPKTQLKPIDQNAIGFNDDKNKGLSPVTAPTAMGGMGAFNGGAKTVAEASQEKGVEKSDSSKEKTARAKEGSGSGQASEGGGESSSGNSSSESGGGSGQSMDALMAQLMGGSPEGASMGFASGQDVLILPKEKESEGERANLFEYAAYRFQKLANEDGRVRKKIAPSELPPVRAIATSKKS
jgi:hypothetical protein